MKYFNGLPPEKISWRRKTKEWRKKHIDWAAANTWSLDSSVRKPLKNKIINYNLINGILDPEDISLILNPNQTKGSFIPDNMQHYPIINSKINVLLGEEASRRFDFKLIVTNPDAISEIENNKRDSLFQDLSEWITAGSENEEEAQLELEKIQKYHKYEWQDIREIRGNAILKHYMKELSFPIMFNKGFFNALCVGEEMYQCDIVGGEPTLDIINPRKMIVLKSGFSDKIEDADMIILWDYWSPGRIVDTFYDVLSNKDIEYLDGLSHSDATDEMGNYDLTKDKSFIQPIAAETGEGVLFESLLGDTSSELGDAYVDALGNVRVIRLYWKSFRKIQKVKSYNLETGEEEFNFFPEDYIPDKNLGEESQTLWVNEAWEGTKIGEKIYVNMRPKIVQYNRLSNPSRCHFGIIGSIYNTNDGKPFSLVDMAKPYNYLYNVVHDRLNKTLATNWGKLIKMDFSKIPKGWEVDKWLYFAKINKVVVEDSFKEGSKGAATGKLAGMLNNQSSGVIDADQGNAIQNDINLLEYIKSEMGEIMGITPQREGQISNRETVGGVERSVLQSSHSTEWLYLKHDDVKKRVLECFLETAKVAMRGKSMKFPYIMDDGSLKIIDIDGDEFAESDYGLVVDNSNDTEIFLQKMEAYAQALIQNQMISTSSLIKLWNGSSISDITRSIEQDEREAKEANAKQMEAEAEQFQATQEANAAIEAEKLRIAEESNIRDNETKIILEHIKSQANTETEELDTDTEASELKRQELAEKIRQYNNTLALAKSKAAEEKRNNIANNKLKQQEINIKRNVPKQTK